MLRRQRKISILDLAARDDANNNWFYKNLRAQRQTASMSSDPVGSETDKPVFNPSEVLPTILLPLYSEDERYMGNLTEGVYQCFEMVDGVYVSHFTCDDYDQLKRHMFFLHT